ncbi:MAG: hypothetical protein ACSLEX_00125 [Minisyncoccota bacterium]
MTEHQDKPTAVVSDQKPVEASSSEKRGQKNKRTSDFLAQSKNIVTRLEVFLDKHLVTEAPFTLPTKLKTLLVTITPYFVIFSIMTLVSVIFGTMRFWGVYGPSAVLGGYHFGVQMILSLVITIGVLILEGWALPGLFKRTRQAWRLLFYVSIINIVSSLLTYNIMGAFLGAVIGWYVLFQIKEYYKN